MESNKMIFYNMTSGLNDKQYAINKLLCWNQMLGDGKMPKKWYKASKKGTVVSFVNINIDNAKQAIKQYKKYINKVNKKFNTAFDLAISEDNGCINILIHLKK